MRIRTKIGLPVLLMGGLLLAAFTTVFSMLTFGVGEAARMDDAIHDVVSRVDLVGVAIRDGILRHDEAYSIEAALLSRSLLADLAAEQGLPAEEAAAFRDDFIDSYAALVSLNSLFLENRVEEAEERLDQIELITEDIKKSGKGILSAVRQRYDRSVAVAQSSLIISAILLAAVTAFLLFVLLPRIVVKPVERMVEGFKPFSEGDFTRRASVSGNDEIGSMSSSFNASLDRLQGILRLVKESAASLSEVGARLSGDIGRNAQAVRGIAKGIEEIRERAIDQSASVTETSATMSQMTTVIERLNGIVERQSVSVAESSAATEEMLASIASVTRTLVNNAENIERLLAVSAAGREDLGTMALDVREISRESESLLEISDLIQGIAGQTNLLSMNAAIEAAHAGEAGRGFAVVADEIRKLAESAAEQAKTVSQVLSRIKASLDSVTGSTMGVLSKFDTVEAAVRTVAEQEAMIRGAMEEQTSGSKEVLTAIGELTDISEQVRSGSAEMLEGSREIIRESGTLKHVTETITASVKAMAEGVREVLASVDEMASLNGENDRMLEKLGREMSALKVE